MPFHALTLTGQGEIKPCCQFKGSFGNIYKGATPADAYKSQIAIDLRQSMREHKREDACNSCWSRENHIGVSRRTWFGDRFSDFVTANEGLNLIQMDLNLSNKCNLKCRMCGSWASHLWVQDDLALSKVNLDFKRESRPEKLKLFEVSESQIEELMPYLHTLKRIDFKGGEPMLAKAHTYLLKRLIEEGLNEKIDLSYTTNGTILSAEIVGLLHHFKSVKITISVEAIGKLYQYIRGGSYPLEKMYSHISEYSKLENVLVCFNVAIQAYNALKLKELWFFLNGINFPRVSTIDAFKYTVVNEPSYLSPWVLPRPLKEFVVEDLRNIPEFKEFSQRLEKSEDIPVMWEKFCQFTLHLDRLRTESIKSVLPEMLPYFNQERSHEVYGR